MPSKRPQAGYLDWTVLKYGWLVVFLIHGIFLMIGLRFLRSAAYYHDPSLYSPEQLRISHLLDSMYMFSIAFSLLLVILAVFVLEIFRTTQKIVADLEDVKDALDAAPPSMVNLVGDESWTADEGGVRSAEEAAETAS